MSAFMSIVIRDIHMGKLRVRAPWDSVFGICGVFVEVLECWARLSGTVHGRKGVRDRGYGGFLIEALEWLNNVPFYVIKRQTMCSITRSCHQKQMATDLGSRVTEENCQNNPLSSDASELNSDFCSSR